MTGKWEKLDSYLQQCANQNVWDFNIGVGAALSTLHKGDLPAFRDSIRNLRRGIVKTLASTSVTSLQSCHYDILQLHALAELEIIAGSGGAEHGISPDFAGSLDRRLNILGGYSTDKQYLLGLRRACMELS